LSAKLSRPAGEDKENARLQDTNPPLWRGHQILDFLNVLFAEPAPWAAQIKFASEHRMRVLLVAMLVLAAAKSSPAEATAPVPPQVPGPVQVETMIQSSASWDGTPYTAYPAGRPEITILKITIAPHTTLPWHTHPMPNAGYILSGDLTIEKKDGTRQHFVAGQAVTETVGAVHRGITGDQPTVLIVFYPGSAGLPHSQPVAP
jgi:quercetin dioxygenase-like cupin family protein